ncbi:hypothetical protein WR25_01609 [Diploscapter pachys]|uniref:BTB domain-containing protein n=1 Tax=Diploscapter pachys TaxID=2018661 RepID=A0A2A2LWY7_9BILA|nr:hypothetical protein WR25_01609 [Diploscapter pachys]
MDAIMRDERRCSISGSQRSCSCPICRCVDSFSTNSKANYELTSAISGFKKLKEQYEEVQLQLDESRQMHVVIVEQLNEQLTKAQSTKNEQGRVEQFKKLLEEKDSKIVQFDAVKLEYEKQIMQMAQAIYEKGSEHNEKLMKMSEAKKKAITEADESINKLNEKMIVLENIKHGDGRKIDDLMQSLRRKDDQIEQILCQLSNSKNELALKNYELSFAEKVKEIELNKIRSELKISEDELERSQSLIGELEKKIQQLKEQTEPKKGDKHTETDNNPPDIKSFANIVSTSQTSNPPNNDQQQSSGQQISTSKEMKNASVANQVVAQNVVNKKNVAMREDNNTKAAWAYIDYECADSANDAINFMNKKKCGRDEFHRAIGSAADRVSRSTTVHENIEVCKFLAEMRCEETQRLYESLRAGLSEEQTAQAEVAESLIGQLVAFTRKLLETHIYSDIEFLLDDKSLKSHRFLLSCRSALWRNLTDCNELTIEDVSYSTFLLIYRWLYTDEIDLNCDDNLLIEIAQAALRYKLTGLSNRCISNLLSRLNSSNCVSIYELAEREQIEVLRTSCATIVAEQWDRFTATDFAKLSAPLLYRLLKGHSKNLLHAIVELARDDVLFLFFMEFDKKLAEVVNETTSNGESPLELSLRLGYTNIAKQLVEKGAGVDLRDAEDNTVLMRMIRNGKFMDYFANKDKH